MATTKMPPSRSSVEALGRRTPNRLGTWTLLLILAIVIAVPVILLWLLY
jgi:hypothetical protein